MVYVMIQISIESSKLKEHEHNANILFWGEGKAHRHIFTGISCDHDDIEDFIEDIGWNFINLISNDFIYMYHISNDLHEKYTPTIITFNVVSFWWWLNDFGIMN